jgi:hypothetical protein
LRVPLNRRTPAWRLRSPLPTTPWSATCAGTRPGHERMLRDGFGVPGCLRRTTEGARDLGVVP